jgi:tetratricopeptide (TPR) repeat protein
VSRGGALVLGVLAASLAVRVAYVLAAPAYDPSFERPMLDGAYYVAWARGILSGDAPAGAYYLGPLFPHALAGLFLLAGERLALLALLQHGAVLATACLLGAVAERAAGRAAGFAATALALGYSALFYFASRPVGEAMAILLLSLSVFFATREEPAAAGAAGLLAGLAALARPNLLLVPAALALGAGLSRRWARAGLLVAGVSLAVLPVTIRNFAASGHLVPISSNGGVTFYHGNGPGAVGVFTPAEGFSADPLREREEATARARLLSGEPLDDVEADRFFRAEALRTRRSDPAGTARLVARRCALLLDDFEHGLDYAPFLDGNPFRWGAPVPFAAILGLAAAGAVGLGLRRSGGSTVWTAIAACASTPILFYVSSRYRLPMSALLAVPAGAGAAMLLGAAPAASPRRRWIGAGAGLAVALTSLLVPSRALSRSEEAIALTNRAVSFRQAGNASAAEADLRRALALDASAPAVWYNLGAVLEAAGRTGDAERAYREATVRDPGHAEAAANLAALLVRRGAAAEAVPILRAALEARGGHAACWSNLVVALVATHRLEEARAAVASAAEAGVRLDPGLVKAAEGAP